jgi:hypothetical protein
MLSDITGNTGILILRSVEGYKLEIGNLTPGLSNAAAVPGAIEIIVSNIKLTIRAHSPLLFTFFTLLAILINTCII